MIRIKYPLFIGKNSRKSDVLLCPPSSVRFLPSSVLRPLSSILCLLSVVLLLSCGKSPVREQLERAEQVMVTDSRAASAVLDSIDSSALRGEEAALYALLKTQADYKSYKPLTSDSLPLVATHYYGTKRKGYRAALSQYYLGCAYGDMHRDLDAIDALLRATTLFPDTTNKYFAYSLFELGKLYLKHEKEREALDVFQRYRLSCVCNTDSTNIGYADMFMGRAFLYSEKGEQAEACFRRVRENTYLNNTFHANATFQLAKLYAFLDKDYDKAKPYIEEALLSYKQKEDVGALYLLKGNLFFHENKIDSAFWYYNRVLECKEDIRTFCQTYEKLIESSLALDKTDSLGLYFRNFVALSDSVYAIRQAKEIAEIQESHVVELHDKELEASHRRFLLWVGLFGIVVLTGAVITYLLADRRRKAERLRYENALNAIRQRQVEQLAQEEQETPDAEGYAEEPDEEPDGLEKPEGSLFVTIQRERIALYRQQFAKSEWPAYFNSHRTDIKLEKKMDAKHSEELRRYLKTLFSEMFVSMLGSNIELTKHDLEYCAMVMLGFNTTQMAYCTQASVHSYHCRHGKMKSMLSNEWYQIVYGKVKQ